jgi:hypothetical protein
MIEKGEKDLCWRGQNIMKLMSAIMAFLKGGRDGKYNG